jgi:antitoxin component YwqK of YwqJK toxin-antitoxin module
MFQKIIKWYKNGRIEAEMYFTNGKENGIFKFWWENGNIQSINSYTPNIFFDGMLHEIT